MFCKKPERHEVVKVGGFTFHFVSHRHMFDWEKARKSRTIRGYARRTLNEVWVFAKWNKKGLMKVNWKIFGHEVLHCLRDDCPMVLNPDLYYEDADNNYADTKS